MKFRVKRQKLYSRKTEAQFVADYVKEYRKGLEATAKKLYNTVVLPARQEAAKKWFVTRKAAIDGSMKLALINSVGKKHKEAIKKLGKLKREDANNLREAIRTNYLTKAPDGTYVSKERIKPQNEEIVRKILQKYGVTDETAIKKVNSKGVADNIEKTFEDSIDYITKKSNEKFLDWQKNSKSRELLDPKKAKAAKKAQEAEEKLKTKKNIEQGTGKTEKEVNPKNSDSEKNKDNRNRNNRNNKDNKRDGENYSEDDSSNKNLWKYPGYAIIGTAVGVPAAYGVYKGYRNLTDKKE